MPDYDDSLTVHGYTVTADQGLTQDERDGLTAYLSMLRKAQDRRSGIKNLDVCPNDDLRCSCAVGKGHRAKRGLIGIPAKEWS